MRMSVMEDKRLLFEGTQKENFKALAPSGPMASKLASASISIVATSLSFCATASMRGVSAVVVVQLGVAPESRSALVSSVFEVTIEV